MASYNALASASSTCNSCAKVVVCQTRAVANFEHGCKIRCAIMASARSRSRHGREASNVSTPSLRIVPRTASTWPCGVERSVEKNSSFGTSSTPLNASRKTLTASGGHAERLAMVVLTILPPSRWASRNKTAGGDCRLGMMSMYMATLYTFSGGMSSQIITFTWVHIAAQNQALRIQSSVSMGSIANGGGQIALELQVREASVAAGPENRDRHVSARGLASLVSVPVFLVNTISSRR